MNTPTIPPSLVWGIFDTLSTPMAILDLTGQILAANQTWKSALNNPQWPNVACGIGENYLERCAATLHETLADLTPIATALGEVSRGHRTEVALEYAYLVGLKPEWCQTRINRWQQDGHVYLVVTHENITAQKFVEQNNIYEAIDFLAIAESSPDMIATIDTAGHILFINRAGRLLLGLDKTESLEGLWAWQFHPPAMVERIQQYCLPESVQKGFWSGEVDFQRRDGTLFSAWQIVATYYTSDGIPAQFFTIVRDISEQKHRESALKASEARFASIFHNSPMAICLTRFQDGRLEDVNDAFLHLFDYSREELIGQQTTALNMWFAPGERQQIINQLERDGRITNQELRFRCKSGAIGDGLVSTERIDLNGEQYMLSLIADITEVKRVRAELEREHVHFKALIQTLPEAIWLKDMAGIYVASNAALTQITGLTEAEILGQTDESIFPPEQAQLFHQTDNEALDAGMPVHLQEWLVFPDRRDSQIRLYETLKAPVVSETGEPLGILGISRDISAVHQAKEALRESEERYRVTLEAINEGLWEEDRLHKRTYCSPAYLIMLGREPLPPETVSANWLDWVHPDDRVRVAQVNQACITGKQESFALEYRMQHQDGSWRWILTRARTLARDAAGQATRLIGTNMDITDRKLAEVELRESQDRLVGILNTAMDAIITVDDQDNIVYFNKAAEKLFGCLAAEVIGQSAERFIPLHFQNHFPDYSFPFPARLAKLWNNEYPKEINALNSNGEKFPTEATMSYVHVSGKNLYTIIMRDISERKQMELALAEERTLLATKVAERTADLRRINAELAQASRMKNEFLATMSHELRTPLNGIINLSESLEEGVYGQLTPKQSEIIHLVNESGYHLLTLINDILDYAKIEAGKLELQFDAIDVESVCQSVVRLIKQSAYLKHQQVSVHIEPGLKPLMADAKRLKQILVNLLANAVKFTPSGGRIGLEVTHEPSEDHLCFTVWDTGIGIRPEHLPRLFKPFAQIDSSLTREYEGTGLGLALVHQLLTLHGGSVSLESTPGQGSRFSCFLPYRLTADASDATPAIPSILVAPPSPVANSLTSPLVLVVDDNQPNLQALGDYLRFKGYRIITARNGIEALALAREFPPDLIFMDIQMVEMDGLEATRQLRALPEFATIPIVALTALAMPGDKEKAIEAGITHYMLKPVKLDDLAHLLLLLLANGSVKG